MDCPSCGQDHDTIDSFPDAPLHLDEMQVLMEDGSIEYVGPTGIGPDGRTPVVAFDISGRTGVASFFEDRGWLITIEKDVDAELLNEMATQAFEAGYRCPTAWMEDGEPGGAPPQPS